MLFGRLFPHWRVRLVRRRINYVWTSGPTVIHYLPPFKRVLISPDGRDVLRLRWYVKYLLPSYKQRRHPGRVRFIDTSTFETGEAFQYAANGLKFI